MVVTSLVSKIFGKFASTRFPKFMQDIINQSYVSMMKVDMAEFQNPSHYDSLNALFTRELIKKREFSTDEDIFISPCDSFITSCGDMDSNRALQIKGFSYSLDELLGESIDRGLKDRFKDGKFINFYLSPKDYHRYHSPFDMRVRKAVHVPGKLYSVNIKWLNRIQNLFIENERVILECEDKNGRVFFMVFVGALNVGKMSFVFDEKIQTNSDKTDVTCYEYNNLFLKKAEELGRFEMGSTIVMFFEKEFVELLVQEGKSIKFGETIARSL